MWPLFLAIVKFCSTNRLFAIIELMGDFTLMLVTVTALFVAFGTISEPFLTYKLGGGGKCPPPVLNFAPRVKRLLTPEKCSCLYRFSATLSNNYCCHRVAMNGTPRVSSAKE